MKKKFKKNKGILFWITGLSGAGKTSIAKQIFKKVQIKHGPTISISGDEFRKLFDLNKFTKKEREKNYIKYLRFAKFMTDQNINVIFDLIGLYDKARAWNRKNIDNYIEIYIKADIQKIIKFNKKKIYKNDKKNIIGLSIKAEYPKKPDIIIENNFDRPVKKLSEELVKKLKI